MGKGKAKGWRPPAASDPNASLLLGSADHLTGDTIASPVQLREEGRALPKNHPNFGDEWGKGGKGKGAARQGQGGTAAPTGANSIPIVAKPKEGWAPSLDPEPAAPKPAPLLKASAKSAAVKSEPGEPVRTLPPVPQFSVSTASTSSSASTAAEARMNEAKTEIERRREAMLQREKAAQLTFGVADCVPDDPEARRKALEARRLAAQAASREAEARRRQGLTASLQNAAVPDASVAADKEDAKQPEEADRVPVKVEPKREREEDDQESLAKRQRDGGNAGVAAGSGGAGKPQGVAMKGLQGWAERVNALAGEDADLVKRCREFVRKRILKAHAVGNLHSVDWGEEPLPMVDELRKDG